MSSGYTSYDREEQPEMELTSAADVIQRLKAVKNENELTLPRIMDMVERNGDYISMTTLRRVFADGSETVSFRYDETIRPIAKALLLVDELPQDAANISAEIEGLKAVIRLKNEEIGILQDEISSLREDYQRKIDFLHDQIDLKDKRMDAKDVIIERLLAKLLDEDA